MHDGTEEVGSSGRGGGWMYEKQKKAAGQEPQEAR